jgi:hypothetical protein
MLLPNSAILCGAASRPRRLRARVAAAPRIERAMTNIGNNFSILFRENAGLIFCANREKAVPIFRRILRRRKKVRRGAAH